MATESAADAISTSTTVPSKHKTTPSTTATLFCVLKTVEPVDHQASGTSKSSVCHMWKTLEDAQAAARMELPYDRSYREYRETSTSLDGVLFEVSAIKSDGEKWRIGVEEKKSVVPVIMQAPAAAPAKRRSRIFIVTRTIRQQKYDPHDRLKKANIAIYETLLDANRGSRQHLLYDVAKLPPPGPEVEDVDAYDDASAKKFDDIATCRRGTQSRQEGRTGDSGRVWRI
jgi:hypothetical protein